MDLLAAVVLISVVEVVVLGLAFRSFERADEKRAHVELARAAEADRLRPRFFGEATVFASGDPVPLDALLARLERHVRVEQEAAERFLRNPTVESLHHRAPAPAHRTH